MSSVVDREEIKRLIADGRSRERSSGEIADQIMALFDDPIWARAASHPVRVAIVRLLRIAQTSPVRASQSFGDVTLGTIAYHFRTLEKLGLVEVCETIQRRGAIEHVYRLKASARVRHVQG